jgi:frataxin-like iron-binding protein CyaY
MPTIYRSYLNIAPIEIGNVFTITVIDTSSYFAYPDTPLLDVWMPGYVVPFVVPFKASLVNTYNSASLGLNDFLKTEGLAVLADGIWKFRYSVCPHDQLFIYKTYMKTTLLDEKIKQIYNKIDLLKCENNDTDYLKNRVVQIQILRESAKAVVEINEQKASGDYQAATKLADDILKRSCNNCQTQ